MKRTTLFISILLLATACLAQEQTKYESSEHHFSFMLPEGWEAIPADSLSKEERNNIEQIFNSSTPVTLCQESGADYFSTPYILVQFVSTEEYSESVLEKVWDSEIGRKQLRESQGKLIVRLQKAEGCLPKSWIDAKATNTKIIHDKNRHLSFETIELYHKTIGKVVEATVRILSSHRLIILYCFSDAENSEKFLNLVNNVVDSFRYDEGYEFGGGKGVASAMTRKLFGGSIWSWIWPIIAISIVFWLINRWVKN